MLLNKMIKESPFDYYELSEDGNFEELEGLETYVAYSNIIPTKCDKIADRIMRLGVCVIQISNINEKQKISSLELDSPLVNMIKDNEPHHIYEEGLSSDVADFLVSKLSKKGIKRMRSHPIPKQVAVLSGMHESEVVRVLSNFKAVIALEILSGLEDPEIEKEGLIVDLGEFGQAYIDDNDVLISKVGKYEPEVDLESAINNLLDINKNTFLKGMILNGHGG